MKKKTFLSFLLFLNCIMTGAQENYTLKFSYKSSSNEDFASLTGIECTGISDIVIPSYVEHEGFLYEVRNIGSGGRLCKTEQKSMIRSITLPSTAREIKYNAFENCSELVNVKLNEGLKVIEQYAFEGCNAITHIEIPSSVTNIGEVAFANCSQLKSIIFNCEGVFEVDDDPFQTIFGTGKYDLSSKPEFIVYTSIKAPENWISTTRTYVPTNVTYHSPIISLTYTPHIIEMISFSENTFKYTGNAPNVTWTNNVDGYTATLDMKILSSEVGIHIDTIPATFTNGEHTFMTKIPYRYTINPVTLHAKLNNVSREYGEENPQMNIVYSGFVSGDNESAITTEPTINIAATKTSNVGEYPITISGGNAKNYNIVYEPAVLTITKAPLSARVNDVSRVYGTPNPTFNIEYSGLKNGETAPAWTTRPTFQTRASIDSNVGQYEVTALEGIAMNYDLREILPGTLNITPAPLTIKANDVSRQYYAENPEFTYTYNGFVNGDDESKLTSIPIISTTANLSSEVGTYEIKVENAAGENYSISNVNGTLTITPRTLVASVGNYEKYYNEDNPTFEVKYEGFVGDDNESLLISKAVATCTATKSSNIGIYDIKVSGGDADNYKFSYQNGLLTINKAEQSISWDQDLTGLKVGDQVELKAVVSSGLPITYMMDNSNAAEIYSVGNKSYLDCKAGGQFLIRAVQNGNTNYYSSPRASNTISILGSNPPTDPTLSIKQADNGTVHIQVSKGSTYTFVIEPSTGWKIHSVTYNDTNVTNQLGSDGRFTTPSIINNSILSVVYEQEDDNAVYSMKESNVKIQSMSNGIRIIDGNMGDMIRVYTTDGLLQHSVKVDNQIVDIPLTKNDIYIVKVGVKTVKLSY